MITLELIEYIKSQLNKNVSKDTITSHLSQVGWRIDDIEEGFSNIETTEKEDVPTLNSISENYIDEFSSGSQEIKNEESLDKYNPETKEEKKEETKVIFDKYRELPEGIEGVGQINNEEKVAPATTLEKLKIWVPTTVKPKNEEVVITEPVKQEEVKKEEIKQEVPIINEVKAEIKQEAPIINEIAVEAKENNVTQEKVIETPVVEPVAVPTKIEPAVVNISKTTEIEPYRIEVSKQDEPVNEFIPTISKNNINLVQNPVVDVEKDKIFTPEVTVPIINKTITTNKIGLDSMSGVQRPTPISTPTPTPVSTSVPVKPSVFQSKTLDLSPKGAMISSYSQDLMTSIKEQEKEKVEQPANKKKRLLKIGIAILILGLLSGMIFAFVEGYLKLPGSKFSLAVVKKDPKEIMLEAPTAISKLNSYKVETNISITSPSLSNITTGLSSGEVVTSKDKDSISINAKGLSNNKDGKKTFDYLFNINSSVLKSDITSDWKYDGSKLFVTVPNLKQIFDKDAPQPSTVSMNPNQLGLIAGELSKPMQDIIKKIDIYNILSNDIPLYVKNETASIFKEFIGSLEYRELEGEFIKGVDTYHYEMVSSRPATKKMLNQVVDLLIAQLPPDQKKNLDEALGASSISAFEVWAGKNNDSLYQFKFTLNVPLSKVLGLNDSGIAGNEVKLDWVTTYYDLDIDNNIIMPSDSIDIKEFVNNIKDNKIKNTISTFKPQTTLLKNAIGSYGLRSNPTGSCTNPNPGSLFSPQGHAKGADTAVSGISNSMISLLTASNGAGSCYSTSNAWALSAPISKGTDSTPLSESPISYFYCADSTGNITTINNVITGPICK